MTWLTLSAALWAIGAWIAASLLTLLLVGIAVLSLPSTHFLGDGAAAGRSGPLWARARRIGRNAVGVVFIVLGALLSIPGVPGQGVLTILIGVGLLDFPGRRRVERALLGRPGVLGAMNRLRACFGRPPLLPPAG